MSRFSAKAVVFTDVSVLPGAEAASGSATLSKSQSSQRCSRLSPPSESSLKSSQAALVIEAEFNSGAISASWEIISLLSASILPFYITAASLSCLWLLHAEADRNADFSHRADAAAHLLSRFRALGVVSVSGIDPESVSEPVCTQAGPQQQSRMADEDIWANLCLLLFTSRYLCPPSVAASSMWPVPTDIQRGV